MLIALILKSQWLCRFWTVSSSVKPRESVVFSFLRVIQGVLGNHTTVCGSSLARWQCSAQRCLSTSMSAERHKTGIHSLNSPAESVRLYKGVWILLRDSCWNELCPGNELLILCTSSCISFLPRIVQNLDCAIKTANEDTYIEKNNS